MFQFNVKNSTKFLEENSPTLHFIRVMDKGNEKTKAVLSELMLSKTMDLKK